MPQKQPKAHRIEWNAPNLVAGAVCLAVLVVLVFHLVDQHRYVRSNDALVQAHFTTLSTRVSGTVAAVFVDENEPVKKDQVLALLDSRDYQTRLMRAAHERDAAQITYQVAEQDLSREKFLFDRGEISAQRFDQAKSDASEKLNLWKAGESIYEAARISHDYASIRALEDGVIALRAATVGQEVSTGDPLFGIVYPSEKWVDARIKETDLSDVKIGEHAKVEIDSLPGRKFEGVIASFSPNTEGEDAPVKADNAAGNYTKYVQRIPVHIELKLSPEDQLAVRAGVSADVRIDRNGSM